MAPIEAIGMGIQTELALSNRVSLSCLMYIKNSEGSVFFLEKEHCPSEREMFLS